MFTQNKTQVAALVGIVVLMLTLLAGCSKKLPEPQVNVPNHTRSGEHYTHAKKDYSRLRWWRKLHDAELNRLVREALSQNNQIKTAEANITQAKAKVSEARFAWLPTFRGAGMGFVGGGWGTDITPKSPGLAPVVNRVGNLNFKGYYSGFVPDYTLNILGVWKQVEFAKASLALEEASYQSIKLSIISQVCGTYLMLLGQRAQLNEEKNLIQTLRELKQLEAVRVKAGASDWTQVTNLTQQIEDEKANLPGIQNSLTQLENALQVLVNRNPGAVKTKTRFASLPLPRVPGHLPSTILKNRPDVMMAMHNLKMAEQNLGIAYSNYFPTVSLTGLLGGASVELARVLSLSTALWVMQAAASVPVLNGVFYEQIKEAKAGYYAAFYTYIHTLRSIFAEVDNSLMNQKKMNQAVEAKKQALQAAQKTYQLALSRYRIGAKDKKEAVSAKAGVDRAKLAVTLARMQQFDAFVQVYQALGGGYLS